MASMSYCRHQNTLIELRACASDLEERQQGNPNDDESLSRDEAHARTEMFELMAEMFEQIGVHIDRIDLEGALGVLNRGR